MLLKRIEISNIRCFDRLTIDLASEAGVKNWLVLVGDNGVGKTSLLRCICLGLGDREYAAGLIRDQQVNWVRKESPSSSGFIQLDFFDEKNPSYELRRRIEIQTDGTTETISKFDSTKSLSLEQIFACGYGAGRSTEATESYQRYRTIDSIYSLFQYSQPMQNPELILRRLDASSDFSLHELLWSIDRILMLPLGSTKLDKTGLKISGAWGDSMPFSAVSDGYQSILSLIVDYIGWAMYFYEHLSNRGELSGIVIVDEIEQHLHPSWQRRLIRLLSTQFPKTQFICTTHSPLCASGTADLPDRDYQLVLLTSFDSDRRVWSEALDSLEGLTADQVLTSRGFGMDDTRNEETEKLLNEFAELYLKSNLDKSNLADAERSKFELLRDKIEQLTPGLAQKEEVRLMSDTVAHELKTMQRKAPA